MVLHFLDNCQTIQLKVQLHRRYKKKKIQDKKKENSNENPIKPSKL